MKCDLINKMEMWSIKYKKRLIITKDLLKIHLI